MGLDKFDCQVQITRFYFCIYLFIYQIGFIFIRCCDDFCSTHRWSVSMLYIWDTGHLWQITIHSKKKKKIKFIQINKSEINKCACVQFEWIFSVRFKERFLTFTALWFILQRIYFAHFHFCFKFYSGVEHTTFLLWFFFISHTFPHNKSVPNISHHAKS